MTKPYSLALQLTLEQRRGLPPPEQSKIHIQLYNQPPVFIVPPPRIQTSMDHTVLLYTSVEENQHICGPAQFKLIWFKGQLYFDVFTMCSESDM